MLCVFSACPPGYLKYHRESTAEVPMCLKSLCHRSAGCPLEEARRAIMQEQNVRFYSFATTKIRWIFFTGSMKMRIVLAITYILNWGYFSTYFPPRRSWCLVAASTHSSAEEEKEEGMKLEEKELEEERHRSRSKLLARRRKAGIGYTRGGDFSFSNCFWVRWSKCDCSSSVCFLYDKVSILPDPSSISDKLTKASFPNWEQPKYI